MGRADLLSGPPAHLQRPVSAIHSSPRFQCLRSSRSGVRLDFQCPVSLRVALVLFFNCQAFCPSTRELTDCPKQQTFSILPAAMRMTIVATIYCASLVWMFLQHVSCTCVLSYCAMLRVRLVMITRPHRLDVHESRGAGFISSSVHQFMAFRSMPNRSQKPPPKLTMAGRTSLCRTRRGFPNDTSLIFHIRQGTVIFLSNCQL